MPIATHEINQKYKTINQTTSGNELFEFFSILDSKDFGGMRVQDERFTLDLKIFWYRIENSFLKIRIHLKIDY